MHGKTSELTHDGTGVFEGLPSPYTATRYHSLIVEDIPDCLAINATSETPGLDGSSVMGFRHRELPIRADHVGKNLPTALAERISVLVYGSLLTTGTPDEVRADERVQAAYLREDV